MARSKEKIEAIYLRRKGESIKEIAHKLNVSVGSVSAWCRDIILTNTQIKKLSLRKTDPYYGKKAAYLEKIKNDLDKKVVELKSQGIDEVGRITKRERFLIGIALYWAEGFKKDKQLGFSNTDPRMMRFFIYWLEECLSISRTNLIVRVTANESYRATIIELEKYWSKELNIPCIQFSKPFFQKSVWKKQYVHPELYHGVLRIKVRKSIDLLRKMHGYIDGVAS